MPRAHDDGVTVQVHRFMNDPRSSRGAHVFGGALVALIFASVVVLCLETVPRYREWGMWSAFEHSTAIIFSLEVRERRERWVAGQEEGRFSHLALSLSLMRERERESETIRERERDEREREREMRESER